MKTIITCLVSFTAGLAVMGAWQNLHGSKEAPAGVQKTNISSTATIESHYSNGQNQQSNSSVNEISLEAIRSIIRAELDKTQQSCANSDKAGDTNSEFAGAESTADKGWGINESISEEQAEAFDKSVAIIEDSLSMGVWDSDMRDQFLILLQQVNPNEQKGLILSVIQAVNNGEIVPQVNGPFLY